MRESDRRRLFSALVALVLVSGPIVVSLGVLVARSLSGADGPAETWQVLRDRSLAVQPLTVAAGQALAATALGAAFGMPASFFLSRRGVPLRWPLLRLLIIPVGVPPVVAALGVREALGDDMEPVVALVLAHALFGAAATAWLVTPSWAVTDRRVVEAARLLGASRVRAFWTLSWPHVRRQFRAALAVAFLAAFAALATVRILGGEEQATLESTVAGVSLDGSVTRAELAVLTLAQFAVAAVVALAGHATWRFPVARSIRRMRMAHPLLRVAGALYLVPLAVVGLVPLGVVGAAAVMNDGAADLDAFTRLLRTSVGGRDVRDATAWTLAYGLGAGVAAMLLAWAVAGIPPRWRRWPLLTVLSVPVLMTPVVLALTLREGVQQIWPGLDRSVALVFAAHTLLAFPIAWRVVQVPASPSRWRLRETAQLLGDRPRTAMARWGEQRLVPSLMAAVFFAFVVSLAEVGAAWLLAPAGASPVGVAIMEAAAGNEAPSRPAFALASILGLVSVLAFLVGEWFRRIAARAEAP